MGEGGEGFRSEARMTTTPTAELARFVAELKYEDLPPGIRERVKDILLDTLASAIAGRHGEETKQIRALAASLGTSREATVIGEFKPTGRLVLHYQDEPVADLSMEFLHKGRPPVVREAVYEPAPAKSQALPKRRRRAFCKW